MRWSACSRPAARRGPQRAPRRRRQRGPRLPRARGRRGARAAGVARELRRNGDGHGGAARGRARHSTSIRCRREPVVGRGLLGAGRGAADARALDGRGATRLVRALGADVVVGTGGYASAPAVIGARLARRPVVLVEPNATAGRGEPLRCRASRRRPPWPGRRRRERLHCPSLRDRRAGARARSSPTPPSCRRGPPWRLLVLGGSQGARDAQRARCRRRSIACVAIADSRFSVVHQAGAAQLERRARGLRGERGRRRRSVVPFLDDVAERDGGEPLVVSRAGAITLAEICAAGRPAVLLPLALAGGAPGRERAALERAGRGRGAWRPGRDGRALADDARRELLAIRCCSPRWARRRARWRARAPRTSIADLVSERSESARAR